MLAAFAMLASACTGGDSEDSDDSGPTTSADIASATTLAAPDESGLAIQRGGELTIGIVAESSAFYPPSAETAFSACRGSAPCRPQRTK